MRRRPLLLTLILASALGLSGVGADGQDPTNLYKATVRKVTDGVYVVSRPDPLRYFVEGNATIIVNDRDVVVVDAGGAPLAARNIIAEIKKLTPKPVRYLINTHDHVDHTLGNQEFAKTYPGVEIISHPHARAALDTSGRGYVARFISIYDSAAIRYAGLRKEITEERAPGYEKVLEYWKQYYARDIPTRYREYRAARITLPTATLEGKFVLHRGARTIEVMFLGHGDTPGDLVVYLPRDRVVCTGDMMTEPVPYGFTPEPMTWVATLSKVGELDFDHMIPGHGAVQSGKTYLRNLIAMESAVQEQVKSAVARGLSLDSTRKVVDLSGMKGFFTRGEAVAEYRFQTWFVEPNVEVLYERFKETPK
jgi:glyoxylase-like metal-dependent hydrolase (beta-lactamase superfamily II)